LYDVTNTIRRGVARNILIFVNFPGIGQFKVRGRHFDLDDVRSE
jgi:hypothetical protein